MQTKERAGAAGKGRAKLKTPAWPLGRWAGGPLILLLSTAVLAKAVPIPNCEYGHDLGPDRIVTFVPNIQSFINYAADQDLVWTEAQVRREIIGVLEEWTHRSQANVSLRLSDTSTSLVGKKVDGINVISMCDPSVPCTANYCCASPCASCGGGAFQECTGSPDKLILESDVVLFNRKGPFYGSCSGLPPPSPTLGCAGSWTLRSQVSGGQVPSIHLILLHEIGHALGLDHSPDSLLDPFSVMTPGGAPWHGTGAFTCDLNKLSVQYGDALALRSIYGTRTDTVRARVAIDNSDPVSWTSPNTFSGISTLAGVGALKSRSANSILFARIGDGSQTVDALDSNGVNVYSWYSGAWSLRNVSTSTKAATAPALAYGASRYILLWHNSANQLVRARSDVGSVIAWAVSTAGTAATYAFTSQRPAVAYEPEVGRTYRLFMNDVPGLYSQYGVVSGDGSSCGETGNIMYQASDDDGNNWTSREAARDMNTNALIRSASGVDFACLDDPSVDWPCSATYVRWNDYRVVWRRVRPNPADHTLLQFATELVVGDANSLSTRAPTIEAGVRGPAAGSSVPDWIFLSAFVRDADHPAAGIRTLVVNGVYLIGTWASRFIGGSASPTLGFVAPLTSSPALGHSNVWSTVYQLYTTQD